jgi:hypothetical protein
MHRTQDGMRATETFILRLFIDDEDPQALRGSIHCVAKNEGYTFTGEQTLLEILRSLAFQLPERLEDFEPGPGESPPGAQKA